MKRTARFPQRLASSVSAFLCLVLLASAVAAGPFAKRFTTRVQSNQQNENERRVAPLPPRTGPPAANLPNLDEVKHRQIPSPRAVDALRSTMRSRHKPLESRQGRTVGPRLPPRRSHHARTTVKDTRSTARRVGAALSYINSSPPDPVFTDDPLTSGVPIKAVHITELRDAINQARAHASLSAASWAEAITSGLMVKASHITEMRTRLDEARALLGLSAASYTDPGLTSGYGIKAVHIQELRDRVRKAITAPSSSDQFVENFLQWGLGRPPTGPESTYWRDILRAAFPQGQTSMLLAMREFGMTIFESAEYAGRNRSDRDFVYDCYKSYLMREPDQEGWDFWTSVVPLNGRENVRRAFDECPEFATLVANLLASGSPSSAVSSMATAQVDPFNQSGNQLQARDAEWGASLISLPGRAGLDLGLGLSYSSLVWTNSGPYMYFDAERGSPSPGFHIGFPTIQDKFFDARVGKNVYLLKTAAGRKVELRQVGTSNVYESADSSYLQLTAGGSLQLRTTDGTTLNFGWTGINEYRCTWIRDRNGNYILINYDWRGDIQNVTDTLGRVITFNYDPNANLNSITQSWNGQTHTWASFGWENLTMQPTVTGVVGTYSGETIPALKMVAFHDGTYTKFLYNNNGQMTRITQYASDSNPATDNHPRNYTAFDYDSATNDCPRLISTRTWAEYWTGFNGVPNEVTIYFGVEGDAHVLTAPDGTVYKETYAGSADAAWMRGLAKSSEVWSASVQRKLSTVSWAQDNPNVNYKTNPRVTQTIVSDGANVRKTTIDYSIPAYAQFGLPYFVTEYAADGVTELRRTYRDYNLSQQYLDQRIIGLVSAVHLTDGNGYQAKVTYGYDDPARLSSQATTAAMHDQNYHGSFIVRGNVTSVSRWDVTDINNATKALTTYMNYNAAGSVVSATDPASHANQVSYADSFSDGNNSRNTFAYPTTVTDADSFSSTIQYSFDFGAKTRVQTPLPNVTTNQPGPVQTFSYDAAARPLQVTTENTGAYTRYVYGPNYVQSFSTVNTIADEAYSITVFDGVGRGFGSANNHPGSAGGYRLVVTIYDRMGRAVLSTRPFEVDNSWVAAGDDAGGVSPTAQTYDWQGRPLRTTHPDGTYKEASYSGCGCAGSEFTILTDEMERQQKVYSDVLGRTWKTEVLDNSGNVYSATATSYNARDQVTAVNSYKGAAMSDLSCPSGTCMQSLTTFDGYGRVATQKLPQQTSPTSYLYDFDDTVQSVTDPRGVIATNSYNNRHLLAGVSYTPAGDVPALASISFGYDAAGNRTSMSDGTGTASYNYDSLSRMTSETRTFTGLSSQTISYGYSISGALTSITDPSGAQVSYNYDSAERLTSMPASGYNGVTSFLSNPSYRATGAIKHATYGNGVQLNVTYNVRMQIGQYQVSSSNFNVGATMSYYADGRTNTAFDLSDNRFDRKYEFDFSARLKEAYSGVEAHGAPAPPLNQANSPYRQTYTYDEWNNATSRTGRIWSAQNEYDGASYSSDNKHDGWSYDAAGNATFTGYSDGTRTYDAAGRPVTYVSAQNWQVYPNWPSGHPDAPALETEDAFDGNGQVAKHVNHTRHDDSYADLSGNITYNMTDTTGITYYLHSTVLGGKTIGELNGDGSFANSFVYSGGSRIATKNYSTNETSFEATNPVTGAAITTDANGTYAARQEPDPLGRELATAPDPTVANDPLSSSKWNEPMPIEYSPQWTGEMESGMRRYLGDVAAATERYIYNATKREFLHALFDLKRTGNNKYYDKMQKILTKNPNFWLSIDGKRVAGRDAADALAGAMANLPGNPLGLDPPQNPQTREQRLITETRNNLINLLNSNNGNNPCAQFFGGAANAIAALNAIPFTPRQLPNHQTGISMNIPTGPVAPGTTYVVPNWARVNTIGGFYQSFARDPGSGRTVQTPNFGGYGSNNNRSRAVQMWHELGHVMVTGRNANGTPQFLLPLDGPRQDPSGRLSEQNTRTVVSACRNQINSIKN